MPVLLKARHSHHLVGVQPQRHINIRKVLPVFLLVPLSKLFCQYLLLRCSPGLHALRKLLFLLLPHHVLIRQNCVHLQRSLEEYGGGVIKEAWTIRVMVAVEFNYVFVPGVFLV